LKSYYPFLALLSFFGALWLVPSLPTEAATSGSTTGAAIPQPSASPYYYNPFGSYQLDKACAYDEKVRTFEIQDARVSAVYPTSIAGHLSVSLADANGKTTQALVKVPPGTGSFVIKPQDIIIPNLYSDLQLIPRQASQTPWVLFTTQDPALLKLYQAAGIANGYLNILYNYETNNQIVVGEYATFSADSKRLLTQQKNINPGIFIRELKTNKIIQISQSPGDAVSFIKGGRKVAIFENVVKHPNQPSVVFVKKFTLIDIDGLKKKKTFDECKIKQITPEKYACRCKNTPPFTLESDGGVSQEFLDSSFSLPDNEVAPAYSGEVIVKNSKGNWMRVIYFSEQDRALTGIYNNNPPFVSASHNTLVYSKKAASNALIYGKIFDLTGATCSNTKVTVLPGNVNLNIETPELKNLCDKTFKEQDWNILPSPSAPQITAEQAKLYLLRFTKPGGFDAKKHLNVLLGIASSEVRFQLNQLYMEAVTAIMTKHQELAIALTMSPPQTPTYSYPPVTKKDYRFFQCNSPEEKETNGKYTLDLALKWLKANFPQPQPGSPAQGFKITIQRLQPLRYYGKYLTKKQAEFLAEEAATLLAQRVAQESALQGGNQSTYHYFSLMRVKELLGLPTKPLSELLVIRDTGGNYRVVIMGTLPINITSVGDLSGGEKTVSYGGFEYLIEKNQLPTVNQRSYQWYHGDTLFEATLDFIPKEGVGFAPKETDFRHNELWQNDGLHGLVIFGANLGKDLTKSTLGDYMEYYKNFEGFKFSDNPIVIPDTVAFFHDRLSGKNPASYMVKEAHSDGDSRNLFGVSQTALMNVGVKTVNNQKETIEIVYPEYKENLYALNATLISNQDFAAWVKEREAKQLGQFVYINGSCSSFSKAIPEIAAARSKILTEIPTISATKVFWNSDSNGIRNIIDGLRHGQNFAQIKEKLQASDIYKMGYDHFIFPDDSEYDSFIRGRLDIAVDIVPKVYTFTPNGQKIPYEMEAIINQH
jgi:hypothetical protein